jgi:TolA-binding protein
MQTVVKNIMTVVVLIGILSLGVSAQASFSGDQESTGVFQSGTTWEQTKTDVASWGNTYPLASGESSEKQRYLQSRLQGLKGEIGFGGYEDVQYQSQWEKKDSEKNRRWAKAKQDDPDQKWSNDPALRIGFKGEHWRSGDEDTHNKWQWMENEQWEHRHWAKGEPDPSPTPIPSAVLLLGSGLSMIGGLRVMGRKREFPKVQRHEVEC